MQVSDQLGSWASSDADIDHAKSPHRVPEGDISLLITTTEDPELRTIDYRHCNNIDFTRSHATRRGDGRFGTRQSRRGHRCAVAKWNIVRLEMDFGISDKV